MIIKKFLHSCILLEKDGKRIVFDPGTFSFIEKKITPQDIGGVDAIFITHNHPDHYDPAAIKILEALGSAKTYAPTAVAEVLAKEGISCESITSDFELTVAGFGIRTFAAPHEAIPMLPPENVGYLVDNSFFHPGDSFHPVALPKIETLALPIAGPWATLVESLAFAERVKPSRVIPIHDVIIKDFMLERIYAMLKNSLGEKGIAFEPLDIGSTLSV